ncbi:MAG: L-threonylcarbamoyladenylate synthase [Bacteroidota bacterium]|nr:L-threonylcarbamoyladenylate synthase [Bacteroidota bacterium]
MKTITGSDISMAAGFLKQGQLVAIPTETVYGLAGNALNEDVVLNIFRTKNRPQFDPLIVHVGGIEEVNKYAMNIPDVAYELMKKFWPGPLTILLQKKQSIPDLVTSGLPTVALRMPNHPMTLALLQQLNFPLAAPSANPFGYISPTTANHVSDQLSGKIPYILDGGACQVGIESTIIGFENNQCIVYRLGGMDIDKIRKITGTVLVSDAENPIPNAPGMLKSHYAPSRPVYFGDLHQLMKKWHASNCAFLCFTGEGYDFPTGNHIYKLSPQGNLDEAAKHLFTALRDFDKSDAELLLAEKFPDKGLGMAINDRLMRAAAKE